MTRGWMVLLGSLALISACGGDDAEGSGSGGSGGSSGGAGGGGAGGASGSAAGGGSGGAGALGGAGAGGSAANAGAGAGGSGGGNCDYEIGANQVLVIEAEDLPLSDSWQIASTETGFTGSGYIVWTGASQNSSPGSADRCQARHRPPGALSHSLAQSHRSGHEHHRAQRHLDAHRGRGRLLRHEVR